MKKKLTPAMKSALDLLKLHRDEGVIQQSTEFVTIDDHRISNQTLLALKRRGLVFCVYILYSPPFESSTNYKRRRWKPTPEIACWKPTPEIA